MKVEIWPTDKLTDIDGVRVRLWDGVTDGGVRCMVFVHRVIVAQAEDTAAFDEELTKQLAPGTVIPLRMIL